MTTPNKDQKLTPLQQGALARKLMEAEIIARAWTDDTFRTKLEADPAAALTEVGIPLPKGRTIRVVHEEPDTVTMVLPQIPASARDINDEELEAVSGGGLLQDGQCTMYDVASGKKSVNTSENDPTPITGAGALLFRGLAAGIALSVAFTGLSWGWE